MKMGIFDMFKTKVKPEDDFKIVMVDQVYLLDVPKDWNQYESDRFRMKNTIGTVQFSATNFGKPLSEANGFSIDELKNESEALFLRFEKEGGYEPINDRELGGQFIYQAFKVDSETQYYYYTFREALDKLIRINFIVREIGGYSVSTKDLILKIGESIKIKVA